MVTRLDNHGCYFKTQTRKLIAGVLILSCLDGCAAPWMKRKKDDTELKEEQREKVKELWQSENRPRTIDQFSRKVITLMRAENIALVTELPGTGGKVESSSQRDRMLETMRRKNVPNPNQWLDDPSTAMVTVMLVVPPTARKKDRLNVIVQKSTHAEATSLESGWLMSTSLVEMSLLGGQVREGFDFAMAQGPLVTQHQISGEETPEAHTKAMVVGGAELQQSRTIGLAIEQNFAHAMTMAQVIPVINKRFTVFDGANQVGVAKPKQENYIELAVPPDYRNDPDHFASVVMHLGVASESADERQARIERCRLEMQEPTTARRAAWQLEAIGKETIPILAESLNHPNKEVRFYSAHALAHLNDGRAIPVLQELAVSEPAFRAMCFNGLVLIQSYRAGDALEELLNAPDPETRYGALLALREYDSHSRLVKGERVGQIGSILELATTSSNLVVVGLNVKPEIVIYGENPAVNINAFMYVNPRLMIRNNGAGRVTISHLAPGRDDRTTECSSDLKSILLGLAEVGCTYGDWVNFVRLCGVEKMINSQVSINPVPVAGRKFDRADAEGDPDTEANVVNDVASSVNLEKAAEAGRTNWLNPFHWLDNKDKD